MSGRPETLKDRLLSPPEVAELLGVCRETLSNWRRQGKGPPFIRFGADPLRARVRYLPGAVRQWLDEQTIN